MVSFLLYSGLLTINLMPSGSPSSGAATTFTIDNVVDWEMGDLNPEDTGFIDSTYWYGCRIITNVDSNDTSTMSFSGEISLNGHVSAVLMDFNSVPIVHGSYVPNPVVGEQWSTRNEFVYFPYRECSYDVTISGTVTGKVPVSLECWFEYYLMLPDSFTYGYLYKKGFSDGEKFGTSVGYDEGFQAGVSQGLTQGYDTGYAQGMIDSNYDSRFGISFIRSAFDSVSSFFNIELIPGLKIWYLISVPVLLSVFYGVMKILR